MFIKLTKYEIQALKNKKLVQPISRWETLGKARSFYENVEGKFTGYEEESSSLKSAYFTPFLVFKINDNLPTI